ncbi:MAG: RNA polymerase sigma factor [Planctomycetota bacterium]
MNDNRVVDEDAQLMKRAARGDPNAFRTLVIRHQASVLNVIYRFIGDRAEAEDLAQEVFIRIWQSRKQYEPLAKFTTYLYRIATNVCLNYVRRKRIISLDDVAETGSDELSPATQLLKKETDVIIKNAIDSLPPNQKMAVILHRFKGRSYKEISEVMGLSLSAVESLLHRVSLKLTEILAPYFKNK